ncbi:hypothetical protein HOY82DRAFT_630987 [Tuber indicum]|nr:hypothetical protein HOY82DRAFT_630987 [Tuber indicum]
MRGMMGNRSFASTFTQRGNSRKSYRILITRPKVWDGEEMRVAAEIERTAVLYPEGHHTEDVMNENFVGNLPDLSQASLATPVTEIKQMLCSHAKQLDLLDKEVASQGKGLDLLDQELAEQGKGLAEERTELAEERTELAEERTELAEERTELAEKRKELAEQRKELVEERTELAEGRMELAEQRMELAAERTELAKERTELAEQRMELAEQRMELSEERTEPAEQQEEIDELGEQMPRLKYCSPEYIQARNQFIRTLKHDMLKEHSNLDHNIVEEGNIMLHRGDVLGDARLYTSPGGRGWPKRKDIKTFKALYGVKPALVSKIKHHKTIDALNAHADTIVRTENNVSQKFRQAFEKLIELLMRLGGDEGDPDGLADACQQFLNCTEHEVMETE